MIHGPPIWILVQDMLLYLYLFNLRAFPLLEYFYKLLVGIIFNFRFQVIMVFVEFEYFCRIWKYKRIRNLHGLIYSVIEFICLVFFLMRWINWVIHQNYRISIAFVNPFQFPEDWLEHQKNYIIVSDHPKTCEKASRGKHFINNVSILSPSWP